MFNIFKKRKAEQRLFLILRVSLIVIILAAVAWMVGNNPPSVPPLVRGEGEAPKAITGIVDSRVTIEKGGTARLVGDASYDPDGGTLTSYIWRIKQSPLRSEIGKVIATTPNAPDQSYEAQSIGTWVYELEIIDDEGEQATAEQVVYVQQSVETITTPQKTIAAQVNFLEGDDPLVGVVVNGQAMAYPAKVVYPHAVVNDVVGGQPIYVVYCEACQTGAVKKRVVQGQTLTFEGFGGTLEEDEFRMADLETGSQWHMIYGEAKEGPLAGVTLEEVGFELTTWAQWRKDHPHSLVLVGGV